VFLSRVLLLPLPAAKLATPAAAAAGIMLPSAAAAITTLDPIVTHNARTITVAVTVTVDGTGPNATSNSMQRNPAPVNPLLLQLSPDTLSQLLQLLLPKAHGRQQLMRRVYTPHITFHVCCIAYLLSNHLHCWAAFGLA
jgi:hypothetical protein